MTGGFFGQIEEVKDEGQRGGIISVINCSGYGEHAEKNQEVMKSCTKETKKYFTVDLLF